jgi:hypothetical protein
MTWEGPTVAEGRYTVLTAVPAFRFSTLCMVAVPETRLVSTA